MERFGDRVFEVLRNSPEDLCVIKGITPGRAHVVRESFAQVATISDIDSWLRHMARVSATPRLLIGQTLSRSAHIWPGDGSQLCIMPCQTKSLHEQTDGVQAWLRFAPRSRSLIARTEAGALRKLLLRQAGKYSVVAQAGPEGHGGLMLCASRDRSQPRQRCDVWRTIRPMRAPARPRRTESGKPPFHPGT